MGGEEDKQKSKFLVSSQLWKQKKLFKFSHRSEDMRKSGKTRQEKKVVNFTRKIKNKYRKLIKST